MPLECHYSFSARQCAAGFNDLYTHSVYYAHCQLPPLESGCDAPPTVSVKHYGVDCPVGLTDPSPDSDPCRTDSLACPQLPGSTRKWGCVEFPDCPPTEEGFRCKYMGRGDREHCAAIGYPEVGLACGDAYGACCGCDWCCNMSNYDCRGLRKFAWETSPQEHGPSCSTPSTTTCGSLPSRRPACRKEFFPITKRPSEHAPPQTPSFPYSPGRHEPYSLKTIRPVDKDPLDAVECVTAYASVAKDDSVSGSRRSVAWLCNVWNRRNQTATIGKGRQRCRAVIGLTSGRRHSFECSFRPPCPERPETCL